MSKTIIFLIFTLVVLASVTGYLYWQSGTYSKDVLKLEILGPNEVQAGDEIEYVVKFKNNGKIRLENAELIFEYPENVYPENGQQRITKEIEDIYPGEERIVEFKARAFGKAGDILKAESWLTYQPKNLKARYESKTSLITQIRSVQLTFEFDLPVKVEQGERLEFSLNYFSNIDYVLENLRIKIDYPEGFEFLSALPRALDETDWDLPSIAQADGGRVVINGILDGVEGSRKIFRAQIGIIINNDTFVLLKETIQTVEIIEPSFYISQLINGSQNYTAKIGDLLHYEIFFKNIGRKPVQKKFIFVKLDSDFFDLKSLKSNVGEFGRGSNSIIWDWKVVSALRFLDAGDEGMVEFWINVKDGSLGRKMKNPVLKNEITVAGTEKDFQTRINSQVILDQKVYYQDEVFGNAGPLPPTIGSLTTYTVLWQLTNSFNDLENVKVKTKLPQGVSVTGKFFPETSKFTFDSISREVFWNVGDLNAYQGFGSNETPLTLAFQIQFVPEINQKGETPLLVDQAEVTGQDTFTSEVIDQPFDGVNTTLPDDETVSSGQGIVQ